MKRILKIIGSYSEKGIIILSSIALVGCLFVAGADVFTRTAVGASLVWAQQIAVWLMLTSGFLLAAVAVKERSHINVNILPSKLKGLAKKINLTFNDIGVVIVSCLLLSSGIAYLLFLINTGNTVLMGLILIPFWWVILVSMLIGLFAMAFYSVLALITTIKMRDKTGEMNTESQSK